MNKLYGWEAIYAEPLKAQFMESPHWTQNTDKLPRKWEQVVVERSLIKRVLSNLTETERQVLACLLSGCLINPQQEQQLLDLLSHMLCKPKRQCYEALISLAQAGIVSCMNHSWYGIYWFMPSPIFQHWRAELLQWREEHELASEHVEEELACFELLSELPNELLGESCYAHAVNFPVAFLLFLHELSIQPLLFTKQGNLNKKIAKNLLKRLDKYMNSKALHQLWDSWFLQKESASLGKKEDHISGALYLLLELAYDMGIIDKEHSHGFNNAKLMQWLSLSQQQQDDIIWHWLLEHFITTLDEQYKKSCFMRRILLYLLDLPRDKDCWLSYKRKVEAGTYDDEQEEMLQLLRLLRECGFVSYAAELLPTADKHTNLLDSEKHNQRKTDAEEISSIFKQLFAKREQVASSYNMLHLEPNGELFLLPGTCPILLWQALEVAELVDVQEIVQLRLTVSSLKRYMNNGHSLELLEAWLLGLFNHMLPDLISAMLQGVKGEVENGDKSEARSQETVQKEFLHTLLSKNAITPVPVDYELNSISNWGNYCLSPLGKLNDGQMLTPQQLKNELRNLDLQQIPRSWLKELRRYHKSTTLQIVETALQYDLALYVQFDGNLWHVVPKALQENEGKWYLTAVIYARPKQPFLEIDLEKIEGIQLANDA